MPLDSDTKLYIKEVIEETIENLPCKNRDNRIRKVEQKVFNGYGTSIKILYGVYALIVGLLVKTAFF